LTSKSRVEAKERLGRERRRSRRRALPLVLTDQLQPTTPVEVEVKKLAVDRSSKPVLDRVWPPVVVRRSSTIRSRGLSGSHQRPPPQARQSDVLKA
jgi:hypothetical protein